MFLNLKNRLKNQKGFTLIELLAVIVILGILAAIAVPSVLGIIDNTKKDAHVANAQQMISAAKMAIASDSTLQNTLNSAGTDVPKYLSLTDLETKNYLDPVDSPDKDYIKTAATADGDDTSYVKISNGKVVGVKLVTAERGILRLVGRTTPTADPASKTTISTKDIVRDEVQKKADLSN